MKYLIVTVTVIASIIAVYLIPIRKSSPQVKIFPIACGTNGLTMYSDGSYH